MTVEGGPIFIRGLSRSGGTLMVTMLDAHPDVAMSYELYPGLLKPLTQQKLDLDGFFEILAETPKGKQLEHAPENKSVRTFVIRCLRGGLQRVDLIPLLEEHVASGAVFSEEADCLRFIERCALWKMKKEGKKRWGLKCSGAFTGYQKVWPDARFLNMVRDGRDVLASQLNTGSFNKTPAEVGLGWSNTLCKFRKLVESDSIKGYEVFYEKLVIEPAEEARRICEFLGLPYFDSMLSFHSQDLTIYKSSHLSMGRISQPVDSSKLERWKTDLSEQQINEFYSVARDTMVAFGFLGGSNAD
ncbi:sulfotransferase [Deltaproteobacteria bacterium]|nr:sulfotransferase [Deltaproteobacteria bacterium]